MFSCKRLDPPGDNLQQQQQQQLGSGRKEEKKEEGEGEEILAHGTDGRTDQPKVVQEVLADLKINILHQNGNSLLLEPSTSQSNPRK